MFRILGRRSSINVRKVLWTAAECGVPFAHEEEWGSERSLQTAEFLALNPNGMVPVLVTEQGALWESNAICRFLARHARRADLLPDEPFGAAEVEKWMDWQAAELNPSWAAAFTALVRQQPRAPGQIQQSIENWNRLMTRLEQHLAQSASFVVGDTFTLADIVLGLSLQRWLLTPMARPSTPALLAYRARLLERPAARAWADPLVP